MADKKNYDWLDDPFNEKAEAKKPEGMGSGAKIFIGCGCLFAIGVVVVLALLALFGLSGLS